jgi:hypothetical protein
MVRPTDSLFLAGILALGVAGLVFFVSKVPTLHEIMQVAMIFAGMLAIAALSAISKYLDGGSITPLIKISFNEAQTRQALDDLINIAYDEEIQRDLAPKLKLWEPTSDILKEEDPALALAKLRIALERELRRIAYEHKVAIEPRKSPVGYLLEMLGQRGVLDNRVVAAIRDVLPVCNMAIHGGEVTPEIANSVLRLGEDLVRVLRVTDAAGYPQTEFRGTE